MTKTLRFLKRSEIEEFPRKLANNIALVSSVKQEVDTDSGSYALKDLGAQATKVEQLRKKVLQYEQLAEDATKAALEARASALSRMEEELVEREKRAKQRLASAVQLLEQTQQRRSFHLRNR